MEDDHRSLMNDDRSVGDRVHRCLHHGLHPCQTDGRCVIVAVSHQTRECGNDDPGYSDSWEGPTADQRCPLELDRDAERGRLEERARVPRCVGLLLIMSSPGRGREPARARA